MAHAGRTTRDDCDFPRCRILRPKDKASKHTWNYAKCSPADLFAHTLRPTKLKEAVTYSAEQRSELHKQGHMTTGRRLFCKEFLSFDTMPCRHMPLLVHFWKGHQVDIQIAGCYFLIRLLVLSFLVLLCICLLDIQIIGCSIWMFNWYNKSSCIIIFCLCCLTNIVCL